MPAVVTRVTTSARDRDISSLGTMVLATEDGEEVLAVPYAPREITYDNLADEFAQIERRPRRPILSSVGPQLPVLGFSLFFGAVDIEKSQEKKLRTLTQLARLDRIVVSYSKAEAGLWAITKLSIASQERNPETQERTRAVAEVELTRIVDPSDRNGPVGGGHKGPDVPVTTYVVKKGDTLHSISIKVYGSGRFWRRIADFNKIRKPKKDDKLKVGRKLKIPPKHSVR